MAPAPPLQFEDPQAINRSQIEQETVLLKQQMETFRVEPNSLLPISSMPHEILSYIFLLCRGCDCSTGLISMRDLLCLTWVCHHWRTVALSTASLWAYIGNENLRWAVECSARAKEAPLEGRLVHGSTVAPSIDVGALIVSLMHRFRQLYVRHFGNLSPNFLTQPAPVLESLTLGPITIQAPLFSGISPLLHTISLNGCQITSWTSDTLPFLHLKHLSLHHCNPVHIITFIQCLPPSLPNLETLKLHSILVVSVHLAPATAPLPPRIQFPNLKTLSLHGDVPVTTHFFRLCNLAPSTRTIIDVNTNEDRIPSGFLELLQTSERLQHHPIVSIRIWHDEYIYDEDSIDGQIILQASPALDGDVPLIFILNYSIPWSEISQIVTGLPIPTITSLRLAIPGILVDDWTKVFAQFIHLEELLLEDIYTARSFICFILASILAVQDWSTLSPVPPFQFLRKLTLCKKYSGSDSTQIKKDLLDLDTALKLRQDHGLRLAELWLPQGACYIDLLSEVVDQVHSYEFR
ncbi:hypothetical protein BDN72DRAFT_960997, partial [Pluteus cervinus]